MKPCSPLFLLAFFLVPPSLRAVEKDTRVYELRIYSAAPGKLEALHARFRDHTLKLFEKHNITNVAYWVPIENSGNRLYYLLSYPSREAREKSWKALQADPEARKVFRDSEKNGKLVEKRKHLFLTPTEYSPAIKPSKAGDRIFELRVYTASNGNFEALNARFRNHTLKLFEKHDMTNIGYWVPMKDQKWAEEKIYFLLAHKSVDAARSSVKAFLEDAEWKRVQEESEKKAGGKLTIRDKPIFLKATDYSPIK